MQGKTPYAIAKHLMEKKIPTPTGKQRWQHRTIENILTNESTKAMPGSRSAIRWTFFPRSGK